MQNNNFLSQLQQKREALQHTVLPVVQTPVVSSSHASEQDQVSYYIKKVRDVDLDSWYEFIKEYTYGSQLIDLSLDTADAMIQSFKALTDHQKRKVYLYITSTAN